MISCHEAIKLLQEYLDGELKDLPAGEVRAHFEACRRCFPHLRLEESFRAAVQRANRGECAPAELRDRLTSLLAEVDDQG